MSTSNPDRFAASARAASASVPTVVGGLGAVAAVIAAGVVLGAGVAPLPQPPLPPPVVVDEDPGLPSDEEPPAGWPAPSVVVEGAPVDGDGGTGGAGAPADEPTDLVDELTDPLEDTTEPLTDPLEDVVEDTVDEVTETVDDTVDEVTDTVDELVDDATETTDDTVDDITDTLDELP